jgi:hypothetical protein
VGTDIASSSHLFLSGIVLHWHNAALFASFFLWYSTCHINVWTSKSWTSQHVKQKQSHGFHRMGNDDLAKVMKFYLHSSSVQWQRHKRWKG